MLKSLTSWLSAPLARSQRRKRSPRTETHLQVESLEGRELMAVAAAGPEHQVNTATVGDQTLSSSAQKSVAMDSKGNYVVVWSSDGEVWGQRYGGDGLAKGAEFRVNSTTTGLQNGAVAAMDVSGDFVVVWQSDGQDGSGVGLYAQRYNASGVAQGSEFRVNSYTAGDQKNASVAMDQNGNFVVSWTSVGQDGAGAGIYAQRFTAAGVASGSEFKVNTFTTGDQQTSAVAINAKGVFVVTWASQGQDGADLGVYAQRYNASGVAQGAEFRVNTYTASAQHDPSIGIDNSGNFVIAWTSVGQDGSGSGVYAQRFRYDGAKQSTEFRVNTTIVNDQGSASVGMDATGSFFIAWASYNQDGDQEGIFGQQYVAGGRIYTPEIRINTTTSGAQTNPVVAVNGIADIVVAWNSHGQDGSGQTVVAQRYQSTVRASYLAVSGPAAVVEENGWVVRGPNSMSVQFNRQMSTTGGATGATSVTNPANWKLTRNGANISSQIVSITYSYSATTGYSEAILTFAASLSGGDYTLTALDTITSSTGERLDGDVNGAAKGAFVRTFHVGSTGPVGNQFPVNTTTTGSQRTYGQTGRAVAIDDDGNYVVVWTSDGQDGSGAGIYARRYAANGVPLGDEFLVNQYTTGDQLAATVAMDADGDFVIVWTSNGQDGNGYGVYARRYDSSGAAQGSEFRVNSTTTGSQSFGNVAMDDDGDFVVTWTSSSGDGWGTGVYAQRFNAAGVAQAGEVRVNTYTTGAQLQSSIAMDSDGDYLIVWTGIGASGYGVYGQRYTAAGTSVGTEFKVQSFTYANTFTPSAAVAEDGSFVVVWTESGADGSEFGIYGRAYDATGADIGTKFRVNSYTAGSQSFGTVAMDAEGNFVVTWSSYKQDGAGLSVYGQKFSALGAAIGSEFRINTTTAGGQQESSIAMNAQGDFVVVWTDTGADGSSNGIFGQRFTVNTPPTAISLSNSTVAEGVPVNTLVGTLSAADLNGYDGLTYTLVTNPGGLFKLTGDQIFVNGSLNYESAGTRTIRVQVTDRAGNTFQQDLVITIADVAPTTPTDSNAAPNTVVEGAKAGTVVGVTASSTDVAGGSAVYSLSDTAGGRFQIGASSGVVTVAPGAVIDYESNTSFTITVLVTVGSLTSTETFTINVLNADPTAPIDSNSGVNLVAEGAAAGALVGVTASAADPAGGAITYSLSNDAGGRFTINPTTGVVTVASGAVIDFESDGGSYTITVVASDGASSKSSDFNINISHPNATAFLAPDLTNPAGTSLYVYGTDGKDAIKVVLKNGVYVVTIGRTNLGSFNPTERIYVYGGDGNDTIDVGATTTLPTVIYGNGGNDTINGGLGADIIIGGAGNDTISGRGGRDLIIGGTGVDRITGHGSGSTAANEGNIMIGDSTDHDSNLAALSAISAAWVANNSSTEATVRSYFSSTTINADGAADAITQTKLGVDWAFAFELKTNGQKLDKLSLATNDLLN